jgi:hypothetical protein
MKYKIYLEAYITTTAKMIRETIIINAIRLKPLTNVGKRILKIINTAAMMINFIKAIKNM